jgi:phenylacetate-CoA ligase
VSLAVLAHVARAHWRARWLGGRRLESFQDRRAREIVKYAVERSPFFRSHWAGRDLGDWRSLPTVDKAAMMSRFSDYNTAGVTLDEAMDVALRAERERNFSPEIRGLTVGLSSGTSGHRGLFLVAPDERAGWAGTIVARAVHRLRPGMRVALVLRANSNLYESIGTGSIRFRFIDLSEPDEAMAEAIAAFRPDVLVAPPSTLERLGARLRGVVQPEQVISVAEVLEPQVADRIAASFAVAIDQIYQCTEGLLAVSCREHRLHVQEDLVAIQWEAGPEPGHVTPIVTDLWRRAQPIVRYRLNDLVRLSEERCECGLSFRVIEAVEGRADDVLVFDGADGSTRAVAPDFARRAVLLADPGIEDYEFVQVSRSRVKVRVVLRAGADQESIIRAVEHEVRATLDGLRCAPVEVDVTAVAALVRSGSKLRRVRREVDAVLGDGGPVVQESGAWPSSSSSE